MLDHRYETELRVELEATGKFLCDKTKDGWVLESDVDFCNINTGINITEWDGVEYPRNYDPELEMKVVTKANSLGITAGQQHAERLIFQAEKLSTIRARILFLGTVWIDNRGIRRVPCLSKKDTSMVSFNWVLEFVEIKCVYYCSCYWYSFATIE